MIRFRVLVAAAWLSALSACDAALDPPLSEPVVVGVAAPLTGSLTRAGSALRRAAEMARDEWNAQGGLNGVEIRLEVVDSGSSPVGARDAYLRLIAEFDVLAILGPYTSSSTSYIIPVVEDHQVVALAPYSAAKGLSAESEWLFRTALTVDRLIPEGVRVTRDEFGYTAVATLTNEADTFSRSARDRLVEEFNQIADVSVVSAQTYRRASNEPVPDLTGLFQSISTATPPPEILFVSGIPPDRIGAAVQAHAFGLDIPIVIILMADSDAAVVEATAPGASEGMVTIQSWIAGGSQPANQAFEQAFFERYLEPPGDLHARGYAAAQLLFAAMAEAGMDASPNAIRQVLAGFRDRDTVYGSFSFDEVGDAIYAPVVGVYEAGRFRRLGS